MCNAGSASQTHRPAEQALPPGPIFAWRHVVRRYSSHRSNAQALASSSVLQARPRLRALFLLVCVSFAMGTASTISVAWLYAWRVRDLGIGDGFLARTEDGVWRIEHIEGRGSRMTRWVPFYPGLRQLLSPDEACDYAGQEFLPISRYGHVVPPERSCLHYDEHARGWPFLALWCAGYTTHESWPQMTWMGGISLYTTPMYSTELGALPWRPIRRGFVLNTALYAAVWGLLMHAGSRAYGTLVRRSRRGKCFMCSYPRTGLPAEAPCPKMPPA
jgi:hypothetical protein